VSTVVTQTQGKCKYNLTYKDSASHTQKPYSSFNGDYENFKYWSV